MELKTARTKQGLTLEELAFAFEKSAGFKISAAHINRIEHGKSVPDILELYWLNAVLGHPLDLFGDEQMPFFVVRGLRAQERLKQVIDAKTPIKREGREHHRLIETRVYNYVPLDREGVTIEPGDSNEPMTPQMQKFLFQVGLADDAQMKISDALSSHGGEEIIYVIEGEIEFWHQRGQSPVTTTKLSTGDCLHFSSVARHGFRALGTKPAQALFVFLRPPQPSKRIFAPQAAAK